MPPAAVAWEHGGMQQGRTDGDRVTIVSRVGRVIAIAVIALVAVGAVGIVIGSGEELWNIVPLAFLGVLAWAAFWAPSITVDDQGLTVRNVLRTEVVPWGALTDVETQYALTLVTAERRVSVWSAPAPGLLGAISTNRGELRHLPKSSYRGDSVRPADAPRSDSGHAALVVRRRWERLLETDADGIRDSTALTEHSTRWHAGTAVALVVLLIASVIVLAL
ncbi:PH domain-containing protein [Ruicaihuangia caeni]|uniref:PH domain-containing protein n=1 Tax=Ruicaihuangia caeni TaxID=3042517 RepID=A0AAW6TCU7_9MICO|nr:PH domain-containing protein [Klugiella sp. YN-L-19]MDI2099648.1 PH domain-containing protein [Klugiella sp. YN-L-19]